MPPDTKDDHLLIEMRSFKQVRVGRRHSTPSWQCSRISEFAPESFQEYFDMKGWDIVHLGIFVDKENQRMLFDSASGGAQESLSVQGSKE